MPVQNTGPMNPPATAIRAPWAVPAVVDAPVREVFDADFLMQAAGVERIEHLFAKAGLVPAEAVDRGFLQALGRGTLDQIVGEFTDYESWAEFEAAATQAWNSRQRRP